MKRGQRSNGRTEPNSFIIQNRGIEEHNRLRNRIDRIKSSSRMNKSRRTTNQTIILILCPLKKNSNKVLGYIKGTIYKNEYARQCKFTFVKKEITYVLNMLHNRFVCVCGRRMMGDRLEKLMTPGK